jgi:hypothetical protein
MANPGAGCCLISDLDLLLCEICCVRREMIHL